MELKLAISTCPNDTFIFDALVNKRIDTGKFTFDLLLTDIQELNELALTGQVDIAKISYAVYPFISQKYQLLTSGSALGRGVGPLVVSKRKIYPDEIHFTRIAIPGEKTTANLLFTLAFPNATQKKCWLFSEIEDVVLSNEADVGVIIHENRFTYQKKGLQRIMDLGSFWEEKFNLPIPLGGIAVRRDLPLYIKTELNRLIKGSVEYAFANPTHSYKFVKSNAQTMDDEVMRQHIDLYVNNFSVDLGKTGTKAVNKLLEEATESGFAANEKIITSVFVE